MNEHDDDPLLDWALGERVGGETPPDLRRAVRAKRTARGAGAGFSRLVAAALLLLGVATVVGVAWWARTGGAAVGPAAPGPGQGPGGGATAIVAAQEPERAFVGSVADVLALPADTRAVEASGVGDDVVAALPRLAGLEVVVLREPWNESFGLGLKIAPPPDPQHVTNAIWKHLAKLPKLRRLELRGTVLAARTRSGDASSVIGALEVLPGLETLVLRGFDTPDDALVRLSSLRSLRELDLSFNHGFGRVGFAAIGQCVGLRRLSLMGCQQLRARWLNTTLRSLGALEVLDLSAIDGINWRVAMAEPNDEESRDLHDYARNNVDRRERSKPPDLVSAEELYLLGMLGSLRELRLGGMQVSAPALGNLGQSRSLRTLELPDVSGQGSRFVAGLPAGLERLSASGDFDDDFCRAVRGHLTSLRSLDVSASYRITDAGLAELCAMPSLRVLEVRQMRGLTAKCVESLLQAKQLEELDLRHCDWLTIEAARRLQQGLPALRNLQTNHELAAPPPPATPAPAPDKEGHCSSRADVEALPDDVQMVFATDLDDDAMPAFGRLQKMHTLFLQAGWNAPGQRQLMPQVRSITDAGLRRLAGLPALRRLRLSGELEVKGPGLDVLKQLPALVELELEQMKIDDAALAAAIGACRLQSLRLPYSQEFGPRTLDAIAASTTLREVSLSGCVHLEEHWLEKLGTMRQLEVLRLDRIGSRTMFSGWGGPLPAAEPGSGVTPRVVAALGGSTRLRSLDLAYGAVEGEALRSLQGLVALRHVGLEGSAVTTADLKWLPAGIESLDLSNCQGLGADLGRVLAATTPRLQKLDAPFCRGLGDDSLSGLETMGSLRKLDLSECPGFGAAAVGRLTGLAHLEELTLVHWQLADADLARIRAMPTLKRLDLGNGPETLR